MWDILGSFYIYQINYDHICRARLPASNFKIVYFCYAKKIVSCKENQPNV